jgi:hypothetical protein
MELEPYLNALAYHFHTLLEGKSPNPRYRVWVFSDSELIVKCGNREYARKANADLWYALDFFETRGYVLRWRWIPRNSNPLNEMCDKLAGQANSAIRPLGLSDDDMHELMPVSDIPAPPAQREVALVSCGRCGAPMLPAETSCPQCERARR